MKVMGHLRRHRLWQIVVWPSIVGLSLLWVAIAHAGPYDLPKPSPGALAPPDPIFDRDLARGVDLVYREQYALALTLLDSLQQVYPDHPGPHFYEAATLQTWMSAYRFNAFQTQLEESVERAIAAGEKLQQKKSDDPWLDFYMGASYGYRAYYRFRRFNFLGAYQDGKRGVGHLRASLAKEPKLYDAYLGLGSYYYWRTARSSVLRWLLFWMPDRRELGLSQIELAMRHGRYSQRESRLVLVTALFDAEQYERALSVLEAGFEDGHSPNSFELYLRGRLMASLARWEAAGSAFQALLVQLEQEPNASVGFRVECRYRIARALEAQGRREDALAMAQVAVTLGTQRDSDAELESILSSYGDVKKDLDRLYRRLSTQ